VDRDALTATTHGDRAFADPLSEAAVDAAIASLDLPAGARALDVGCGGGALLARAAGRSWGRGSGAATRAGLLEVLGARADDLPDLDGLEADAIDAGWAIHRLDVASDADWAD
jgi:SAM-dependent methyltransferase